MDQFDPKVVPGSGTPSLDTVNEDPFPNLSTERPVEDYFYSVLMPVLPAGISREAMGALLESSDHFNWEVLTKEIDGEERSIVLFGERHNPETEDCVKAAEKVLQQFRNRALESFFSENYPFSKLYSEASESTREFPGAISIAAKESAEQEQLISDSLDIILEQLTEFSDTLSGNPDAPKTLVIDPSTLPVSEDILTEAIVPLLNAAGATVPSDPQEKKSALITKTYLELHHKPGLLGKLHATNVALGHGAGKIFSHGASALTLISGMIAFPIATAGYIFSESVVAKFAFYASLPGAMFFGAMVSAGLAIRFLPGGVKAYKAVQAVNEFLKSGYHAERDTTMAAETMRVIESNTDKRPLLVQIGRYHVLPIREKLENAGWKLQIKSEMSLDNYR